ncbi:MAG: D-aminoacylase [Chlorobia bacterium]|nr:D-aminoacylase [Fimbriimonadaceae bacterium]
MKSLAFILGLAALAANQAPQRFDLLIKGGRVVDGTGNPAYFSDIAVNKGRIIKIGRNLGVATQTLDAKGMVVAPGFIDVHTHAENVTRLRDAENYIRMGVTTIVVGNCGGSTDHVASFFKEVDGKVAVNVATLIGHNTVRSAAMKGSFNRPPSPAELTQMKMAVDNAMRQGACGLSTGLIYLPGTFAKTDEIVALAKVANHYDGIYASHMRNESDEIEKALDEAFAIGRGAGIRVQVSHLKLGKAGWGNTDKVLDALAKARQDGLDVTQDQYVYTASSTSLTQMIPSWAKEGGREKFRERLKDPAIKQRMIDEMQKNLDLRKDPDYAYAVVASYSKERSLNGLTIPAATKKVKGADDLASQMEFIFEVEANGGASGVFFGMNEEDIKTFMQLPTTMFAADGSCRDFGKDVPHPRSYGNNARVLARYVREFNAITLEDAIRKMTSLPANSFRFHDRGLIKEGMAADIVVFDADKVRDVSTYDDPHHYAEGFRHVVVNGVPVIVNEKKTGKRPGRAMRHKRDTL